jgi:Raf kinase inhibitor-like YbhB/YbcL family protein
MNNLKSLVLMAMLALGATAARADTFSSFVGTLSTSEDFFSTTIAVTTNFVCNVGVVGHLVLPQCGR